MLIYTYMHIYIGVKNNSIVDHIDINNNSNTNNKLYTCAICRIRVKGTYIYVCINICMCLYMCINMCMCLYMCINISICCYICINICIYVSMYLHICFIVYVYVFLLMHICECMCTKVMQLYS